MDPLTGFLALALLNSANNGGGRGDGGGGGGGGEKPPKWPAPPDKTPPTPGPGVKSKQPPAPAKKVALKNVPAGYSYYQPPSAAVVAKANAILRDPSVPLGDVVGPMPDPTAGAMNMVAFRKEPMPTKDKPGQIGVTAWKKAIASPTPATPVDPAQG